MSRFERGRASTVGILCAVACVVLAGCGDDAPAIVDGGVADASADGSAPDAGMDAAICRARVAVGAPCAVISDCDDGCFCNGTERCEGVCVAGTAPCTDPHACTTDTCDEPARACAHVPDSARCDDADACNGLERCDAERGCQPGAPPFCDDGDDCTADTCAPASGCVNEPRDRDGDGFGDGICGGLDCLDDPARGGASVAPGRSEVCDNGLDDDCDGITDYESEACLPMNDTCATAQVLSGPGSYIGSTRGLRVDYVLACASGTAPGTTFEATGDAVFRFTLREPADVSVATRVTRDTVFSSPAVALRRADDCATGPELRPVVCAAGERVRARSLPAGEYAIVVATVEPSAFLLTLDIRPPTVTPPIDVCAPDMLEVGGGGTFSAYRSDLSDDAEPPCGGLTAGPQPDAVYRLTLDAPKDVRIALHTGTLALLVDCTDPASAIACVPYNPSAAPVLVRRALPAGTYFVFAEPMPGPLGSGADALVLDVRVTDPVTPPRGDSCSTAIPLEPGVTERVSVAALEYDVGIACTSERTYLVRDAVFTFTTTETRDVTLTLDAPEAAGTLDTPAVALTPRCGEPADSRTCTVFADPARHTRTWRSLPAGTWFVIFGTGLTAGTISARIALSPPTPIPVNDLCADALPLENGRTVTMTPALFSDDESPACDYGGGNDAFYRFTLTEPQQVDLVASASDGSQVALLVQRTCGGPPPVACAFAAPAGYSGALAAGTYTVLVDAPSVVPTVRLTPFFTPL